MKSIIFVAFLLASCLAVNPFVALQNEQKERSSPRAVTCTTPPNYVCSSGGTCSTGCPGCTTTYSNCLINALNDTASCQCNSAYVDCLAAYRDATCDSEVRYEQCKVAQPNCTCGTPYTGVTSYSFCNNDNYCDQTAGKCVALKSVGSPCVSGSDCGDSNAGPFFGETYECINGKCAKEINLLPGNPCTANTDCVYYANFSLGCSNGVCQSQSVGKVCPTGAGAQDICGYGLYCDGNTCESVSAMGGNCDATNQATITTQCGIAGLCGPSGICIPYFSKAAGEACNDDGECQIGNYCSESKKVCAAFLATPSCNDNAYCEQLNADYQGCQCNFEGNPVCTPPSGILHLTQDCADKGLTYIACLENNKCNVESPPPSGGCVDMHCSQEFECYNQCVFDLYKEDAALSAYYLCLGSYSEPTCPSNGADKMIAGWVISAFVAVVAILL